MQRSHRWVVEFPAAVLAQIDLALGRVKDLDWRRINRDNSPLPGTADFFADLRELGASR